MNRTQFKLAHHEFRELNFKARTNTANHICTARNCACNDWRERHVGLQWHIAQQHGEGMATRLLKMLMTRKAPSKPVMSWETQVRIGFIKDKKKRIRVIRDILNRIDAKFPKLNPAISDLVVNPPCSNTSGRAEVADLLEVCSISGDAS